MRKLFIFGSLAAIVLVGLAAFFLIGERFINVQTGPQIRGLRVGMKMDEAHRQLEKIGTKQKNESKLQEVWTLNGDKNYSHIIISFNKDDEKVRFINAKANENGERVRYGDVIDLNKARQDGTENNYKYVTEFPSEGKYGYRVIARGTDKNYLSYYAVERLYKNTDEDEDEEDDE